MTDTAAGLEGKTVPVIVTCGVLVMFQNKRIGKLAKAFSRTLQVSKYNRVIQYNGIHTGL